MGEGAREIVQWLRACFWHTYGGLQSLLTQVPGTRQNLLNSLGIHTVHTHTCRQNSHTHKTESFLFEIIFVIPRNPPCSHLQSSHQVLPRYLHSLLGYPGKSNFSSFLSDSGQSLILFSCDS